MLNVESFFRDASASCRFFAIPSDVSISTRFGLDFQRRQQPTVLRVRWLWVAEKEGSSRAQSTEFANRRGPSGEAAQTVVLPLSISFSTMRSFPSCTHG